MERSPCDSRPGTSRSSGPQISRRLALRVPLVLAVSLASLALILGIGVPPAGVSSGTAAPPTPALLPGDWVDFHCTHGEVKLNGSSVCHDQSVLFDIAGGDAVDWYTMVAVPDTNYLMSTWATVGDACLNGYIHCGRSSVNASTTLWGYCASGERCSGSVTLTSVPAVVQHLTARIFDGFGTIDLNGTVLSNGQGGTVRGGAAVSVSADVIESGYKFYGWLSDDGSFANSKSSSTTFTAANSAGGTGNISLVVNQTSANRSWSGLVATGSGLTRVSGTFNIPYLTEVSYTGNPAQQNDESAFWVGFGGLTGIGGTIWQAGVAVQHIPHETITARAWYEAPSLGPAQYNSVDLEVNSTVTVTVIYYPSNETSAFSIVCDTGGGLGCGWSNSTWRGSVSLTPDDTTADWIVEGVTELDPVAFSHPEVTATGGSSVSYAQPVTAIASGFPGAPGIPNQYDYVSTLALGSFTISYDHA
jgi:hypothetical protein